MRAAITVFSLVDDRVGMIRESTLKCPVCGFEKEEVMPLDACLYYYECTACHTLLRPKPGDCCVFCSYGTVKCPPMQMNKPCSVCDK